jgi:hypothetical protein
LFEDFFKTKQEEIMSRRSGEEDESLESTPLLGNSVKVSAYSMKERVQALCEETLLEFHDNDDAVSVAVKRFTLMLCITIILWIISFDLVMMQIISRENFSSTNWAIFTPMWVGTCLGFVGAIRVSLNVCSSATLITRDRKVLLVHQQHRLTDRNYVDHQSLPLMRRLFCWSIVLSISFFIILTAQILFYLWFAEVLSIWDSIFSIGGILFVYLLYMYVVNIFSMAVCFVNTLLIVELVRFLSDIVLTFPYSSFLFV